MKRYCVGGEIIPFVNKVKEPYDDQYRKKKEKLDFFYSDNDDIN
jgi:hypothetical protein